MLWTPIKTLNFFSHCSFIRVYTQLTFLTVKKSIFVIVEHCIVSKQVMKRFDFYPKYEKCYLVLVICYGIAKYCNINFIALNYFIPLCLKQDLQ